MIDIKIKKDLKDFPILDNGEVFIYIMSNADGKWKIGQTTNVQQRYQSLSGSNSGGVPITEVYVSEPTYLYSIEKIMHGIYDNYRITGTEWFTNKPNLPEIKLRNVIDMLQLLFSSADYNTCNDERKRFNEDKKEK